MWKSVISVVSTNRVSPKGSEVAASTVAGSTGVLPVLPCQLTSKNKTLRYAQAVFNLQIREGAFTVQVTTPVERVFFFFILHAHPQMLVILVKSTSAQILEYIYMEKQKKNISCSLLCLLFCFIDVFLDSCPLQIFFIWKVFVHT